MPRSYKLFKDEVKDWFLDNVPLDTSILDVGAGCGTYSDLLCGYGYKMDAVEIWQPYVTQYDLKHKYKWVYEEDVLKMPSSVLASYEFYIIGDVLEHMSVDDAQWFLKFLRLKAKMFLVAVPYKMEQGAYEGNTNEIHLQPDLTPEIMGKRYPDLELLFGNESYGYYINKKLKYEKAYVLYADNSYMDLLDACCRSIRNFSNIPIYAYVLNSSKKINVENTYTIKWECDVKHLKQRNEYIKREDKQIYKLLIERPKIVKHALKNFADQVAYIDTDSIATERVDSIFDYFDKDSTYPYFTEGIYEYLIVNGRGGAESKDDLSGTLEAPACQLFGINQSVRQKYRQTGYFVAGKNCLDWLDEWAWMCQHPSILRNNAWYAPFNEESIMNCLLWKNKQFKGLPYCYINGLHNNLEYKDHEYFLREWQKVPLKENHLFYHGEKDIDKLKNFNENFISSPSS